MESVRRIVDQMIVESDPQNLARLVDALRRIVQAQRPMRRAN
jgi:hypothetical protein